MTAINKDLLIDQGSDFDFLVQVEVLTNPAQEYDAILNPYIPLDLSLYTALMEISVDYYSAPILTLTNVNYITLDNLGNINTAILAFLTEPLVLPDEINDYVYQLEIKNGLYVKRVCQGKFTIIKNLS